MYSYVLRFFSHAYNIYRYLCKGENLKGKIKVFTLKDIFGYLAKTVIVFGVIAVFANFFYGNKDNINSYFTFNSSRFLDTLKHEVSLLKNESDVKKFSFNGDYIKSTISNEISMFNAVATNSLNTAEINDADLEQDVAIEEEKLEQEIATTEENAENNLQTDIIQEAETNVNVLFAPSGFSLAATSNCSTFTRIGILFSRVVTAATTRNPASKMMMAARNIHSLGLVTLI